MDFATGFQSTELQDNARAVRCVRGQVAPPLQAKRFEVSEQAGTVLDTATQLTWQRALDTSGGDDGAGRHNWLHAKPYCAGLTLAGGGWRVPEIRELRSLVDTAVEQPALDHGAFPAAGTGGVWSMTQSATEPTAFWFVDFLDGFSDVEDLATQLRVRCVR